ncbi:uncharacterized protein LOC126913560 [Cygnus atratus]|uniref:uncharacterized protein LOC126913560 n=1 Tax=Cygnus atratus TaxID=8868 RepID=UPI0021B84A45|nr:uncharacterized protein LOC126913560 [Cygnus atratus]
MVCAASGWQGWGWSLAPGCCRYRSCCRCSEAQAAAGFRWCTGASGRRRTGSQLRLLVGTMAGHRQLVLPLQGLLLCVVALHFGSWGPLATAEHEAAPNASSVAPNASSVAPNASSVAPNASSVAPNASSVAPNASVNSTEGTLLTCQSFQCSGERCYQDEAYANETATCHNETFCELYRFSSTNYTARCSSACGAEPCGTNSSVSLQQCALECCDTPLCLQLNASSYGDLPATTTPPTTTVATTPRPPPRNGKVCAAFSCHGDGCFKGKKATARCIVGYDFCQMKKTGLDFVAGCSKACKAAKPVCAKGVKAACYQECCPATPKASCLKLDGKIHVNGAGQALVHSVPL